VSAIKPYAPLDATEEERVLARSACAARARERGEDPLALEYEMGTQDQGWALRHEVNRMRAEANFAKPQAGFAEVAHG
jgi:hypothetical protein